MFLGTKNKESMEQDSSIHPSNTSENIIQLNKNNSNNTWYNSSKFYRVLIIILIASAAILCMIFIPTFYKNKFGNKKLRRSSNNSDNLSASKVDADAITSRSIKTTEKINTVHEPITNYIEESKFKLNEFSSSNPVYSIPRIPENGNDTIGLFWFNRNGAGSGDRIFFQRYSKTEGKIGDKVLINLGSTQEHYLDDICVLDNGNFMILTCGKGKQYVDSPEVYYRIIGPAGEPIVNETMYNTYADRGQQNAKCVLAKEGNNELIHITWDSRHVASDNANILYNIFNTTNMHLVNPVESQINVFAAEHQYLPSITTLSNGGIGIAYYSYNFPQDNDKWGVVARFSNPEKVFGDEILVNNITKGDQGWPIIRKFTDKVIVGWFSGDNTPTIQFSMKGRILKNKGDFVTPEFSVTDIQPRYLRYLDIKVLNDKALFVWENNNNTASNIQAAFVGEQGRIGNVFDVTPLTDNIKDHWPRLEANEKGSKFIITFDREDPPGTHNAYAKIYTLKVNPPENNGTIFAVLGIVGGTMVCYFAVGTGAVLCLGTRYCSKKSTIKDIIREEETLEQQIARLVEKCTIKYSEIKNIKQSVGSGSEATVYSGEWEGISIAFKLNRDASELDNFKREVELLLGLNHPNIVRIYGVCLRKDRIGAILEYATNKSLKDYAEEKSKQLTLQEIYKIMMDMLRGLRFLHSKDIVHRDLKPENVLMFDNGKTAKLADFGFSKQHKKNAHETQGVGTAAFQDPTYIALGVYLPKCDMYSFAITIIELLCVQNGKKLYSHVKNPMGLPMLLWNEPTKYVQTIPNKNQYPKKFVQLINRCRLFGQNDELDQRPSSKEAYEIGENLKDEVLSFKAI